MKDAIRGKKKETSKDGENKRKKATKNKSRGKDRDYGGK